ncbi:MAG: amino acid permease, partial [Alteromonas sp.]|nr:amino acid permease [Alteromonas sp.]
MGSALQGFSRTKTFDLKSLQETKLARVLTTFDLTFLGVGSTLGAGVYVVTGDVARDIAGPGVVLSFVIAGFASVLSGLCYAEFGARVPKAGSSYIYSYVTVGELCAFIIGWNLFLEYMIGAAAVARAWSSYLNSLVGNTLSNGLIKVFGTLNTPGLSHYPDVFSLLLTIVISIVLAIGVKGSTRFQGAITFINMAVIVFIVIVGAIHATPENWKDNFLPYGFSGVLSGSATAFFAFVGFDVIASTGEEAKNPSRAIPLSIVLSLALCSVGYCGVATVVTMLVPYNKLDVDAALPKAFETVGISWAKYVISIGALCGLTASLTGAMFPLPRLLYAMATDGLIFKPFAWVNSKTETPLFSTFLAGLLAGTLAMVFELSSLVEMMSIG